ncbi:hypothetical protein R0J90_15065, partial [Micrococcus sp. SIMBA_144]
IPFLISLLEGENIKFLETGIEFENINFDDMQFINELKEIKQTLLKSEKVFQELNINLNKEITEKDKTDTDIFEGLSVLVSIIAENDKTYVNIEDP